MQKFIITGVILSLLLYAAAAGNQPDVDFEALDHYIGQAVTDFAVPGLAIAIVKDGQIVFRQGYGLKNAETDQTMTTGSLFNIASCTKAFTAASIGILIEEGKLNWTDKITDHVPGFRLADPYITSEMNITDILSHRSGLATFYGDLLWYETDYTNRDIIHRMRYLPLHNDFRSEFGYQNNMFMIAGEIIEAVSGKPWSDFVYERLLKPLDMTESRTCSQHLGADQDIAFPHLNRRPQELPVERPYPAGTIYSSVDEMANWIQMLLNGGTWREQRILSPETIEELFTPQTLLRVPSYMKEAGTHFSACGLGWFLSDYSGVKVVEHSGGMPGYISKVAIVPEANLGFVILTNDMSGLPNALRNKILDLFLNDRDTDWAAQYLDYEKKSEDKAEKEKTERRSKRASHTSPSLPLADYTGTYEDRMYGPAEVGLVENELWLTLIPTREKFVSRMEHWHYDTFRIQFQDEFLPEGFVTFHFNADGEVTNFTIDLPNPDFHFFNLDFKRSP